MTRLWLRLFGTIVFASVLLGAAPLQAASLQKVEQSTWGVSGLPSYVNMYIYVPDALVAKPPILVASHHCGGAAQSTFNETKSSFVSLADKNGFVIIFPEATGHNCWDVGSAKSLEHDGGGDTHAIAQMVRYALGKYAGDARRVYAFGTSSGAMMTQALLGVYAEMFMAGVSVAGVACGCWAVQYSGDSGQNAQWSGPCAGGDVHKTAQQWGDLVRAMFPGYMGHRPRVQLWHGTADTTISFKNLAESIKQWTNLLSLNEAPSASDTAKSGYTHQSWKNTCGYVALETWAQQGAGHGVSWDAAAAAGFLGLDRASGPDPEAVACPGATAGAAGSLSTTGNAGAGGSAGAAGDSAAHSGAAAVSGASEAGGSGGAATAGRAQAGAVALNGAPAGSNAQDASTNAGAVARSLPSSAGAGAGTLATPASGAATASSAGCGLFLDAREAVPNTKLTIFTLATLGLALRRRWYRAMRRCALGVRLYKS